MARPTPSSRSASEPTGPGVGNHYGQRLGLPASGSRSLAGTGRRALALLVDWLLAYGLAGLAIPFGLMSIDTLRYSWVGPTVIMAIWMALGAVSVRLFTFTPGQYALGLMVISVDGRTQYVGFGRALVRVVLIAFVIPALFVDSDGRGIQDRITGTAVVRR